MNPSHFQKATPSHEPDDLQSHIESEDLIMIAQLVQQAAPIPRDRFKEALLQRLSNSPVFPKPITFRESRKLTATLPVVAILLMTAAVVYAVGTFVQRAIQLDGGLSINAGQSLNLQQTIDGTTLTAEWIYADNNRISVGLSTAFDSVPQVVNGISPETRVRLTDANGIEYPLLTATGTGIEQNTSGMVYSFAVPDGVSETPRSAFRLTVDLQVLNSDQQSLYVGMFQYDISTSTASSSTLFNLPQTTTANDITVTLASVQVSPSLTRIETCFAVQDASFSDWFPNVYLRVGSRNLNDGTVRIDGGSGTSPDCRYTNFYVDLSDVEGTWAIEITELIGTRMLTFEQMPTQPIPSESFERRITGPWQFILEGEQSRES